MAAQPPSANSAAPAQPSSKVQNQTQQSPPVVAPAVKTDNSAALAQAALEAQRRQDEEKAKAQAALEAQKRREEQQKQAALEQQKLEENQRIYEQIKTTLAAEAAQVSKFKAQCQTRLDNNTNKIAGVARSARKTLNQFNDTARANFPKALQEQENMLNHFQGLLPSLSSDPQSDPRQFGDQMTNYIAAIEDTRQKFTTALNDLDTDISNAPKRTVIPFLNIKAN